MIDLYALEPELVATWARRIEYRFIYDKFGLGTPRAMLEFPKFTKWKRAVFKAAQELGLSEADKLRLAEVFKLLADHKHRRPRAEYNRNQDWLQNAEGEYKRRSFAAILAQNNPRDHCAVILGDRLGDSNARWDRATGVAPKRTPLELVGALRGLLINATSLHLVDPHFGPDTKRHREVLRAMLQLLADHAVSPEVVVYCSAKADKKYFEGEAARMGPQLPSGSEVKFVRLCDNRERLHNRYVLSNLGGVTLGAGLDEGHHSTPDQTDDVTLMSREQFLLRWEQYVKRADGAFIVVDQPRPVVGGPTGKR